jgi:hypothetical protein
VDNQYKVTCNGVKWTMTIYESGTDCFGRVLDTVVGDSTCTGKMKLVCVSTLASGALSALLPPNAILLSVVVTAISAVALLL